MPKITFEIEQGGSTINTPIIAKQLLVPTPDSQTRKLLGSHKNSIFDPAELYSFPSQDGREEGLALVYPDTNPDERGHPPRAFVSEKSIYSTKFSGRHEVYAKCLAENIESLSSRLKALDLRHARMSKSASHNLHSLSALEIIALPLEGADLSDAGSWMPERLQTLIISSVQMDQEALGELSELGHLNRLQLNGCWYDEVVLMPHVNPGFKEYGLGVDEGNFPTDGMAEMPATLREMSLIDCDENIPILMLYSKWLSLEKLTISASSFRTYGVGAFMGYLFPDRINNVTIFPKLETLVVKVSSEDEKSALEELVEKFSSRVNPSE